MEEKLSVARSEVAIKKLAEAFDAARECGVSPEFRQTKHCFVVQLKTRKHSITIQWKKELEVPDVCCFVSLLKAMS